MIYFSLPRFYENYKFNEFLSNYIENNSTHCNFKCCIEFAYGNFPFCFWNGGVNNNEKDEKIVDAQIALNFIRDNTLPICLDMSNIFLEEKDFYDVHLNMVLEVFSGRGNYIILINPFLKTYITNKYDGYNFIYGTLGSSLKLEEIPNCAYIEAAIHDNANFLHFYDKKNTYITIGSQCQCCSKETYNECRLKESKYQILFSEQSCFNGCAKAVLTDMNTEFDILHKQGFNHFKIANGNIDAILNLIFKPEYHNIFKEEFDKTND